MDHSCAHRLSSIVAVLILAGSACKRPEAPAEAGENKPVVIGSENYVVVKREMIHAGPRVSGSLEPAQQAKVRAEAGGSVIEVKAELGDTVKSGQVLARIEERSLRDGLVSAESALRSAEQEKELAERQVARTMRLVQAGALAEHDLEMAKNAAGAAQARFDDGRSRLALAKKALDATVVKAPLAGVISERAVSQGDVVAPGAQMFTVIDPSSMRLQGSIPSEALSEIVVGRSVGFTVRGYRDQTFEGKIEQIAPAADQVTRQITVLVSIPNPGGKLVAGLFAEGRVATEAHEGLVVPLSAVVLEGDQAAAMRVKDGHVERVEVRTGIRDEQTERIELVSGVAEGDSLLSGSARGIVPGTPVSLGGGQPAS